MTVGVIAGQFQVERFARMHWALLAEARENYDKLVIAIDGNELKLDAPLDVDTRVQMLRNYTPLDDRLVVLPPSQNAAEWSAALDAILRSDYPDDDVRVIVCSPRWGWGSDYCGTYPIHDLEKRIFLLVLCGAEGDTEAEQRQETLDCSPRDADDFRAGVIYAVTLLARKRADH